MCIRDSDHPGIKAVSFVGSTKVAKIVYVRASASLKRAVCLGGAKNHLIVLPDAHVEMTASNVVASMSGCAGQRCMAAAQMVGCLLYTSPSPRDRTRSRMPSSA